jgi:predicted metalloprotease with PDZ domain
MRINRICFVIVASFLSLGFYNLFHGSGDIHSQTLNYVLEVEDRNAQTFGVKITVEDAGKERIIFRMPRWSPGAYRIREYAENVVTFAASNRAGKKLNVQKISDDGWQVLPAGNSVIVEYQVAPAYETWSQVALDSNYALVEGPSIFMYIEGKTDLPIHVEYRVPDDWSVASPLKPLSDSKFFFAKNYDVLVDSPAQLGEFERRQFTLKDVPIDLIFHGSTSFAVDSFLVMVQKICEYQADFFNEIPFDRYVFFYKIFPGRGSGGGLEHSNSTTIGLSGDRLSTSVISAAEVTAHEFFHAWNVELIRPKVLEVIDYTQEERTKALWFCEGVTSYYESLTMVRTGLWNEAQFLNELKRQIEGLQENRDRRNTSVEDASQFVWERGYIHTGVSFYNKGQLLGLLLDLQMRQATGNRASLDEVMRFMNWWFAKGNVGFEEHDIQRAVNAVAQRDFSDFFEKYVAGTQELPLVEALAFAGYSATLTSDWVPSIGDIIFVGPRNRVIYVEEGSQMADAGVIRDDYLRRVADIEISSLSQLTELIRNFEVGAEIAITVMRDGEELALRGRVGKKELVACEIESLAAPDDAQMTIRRGWLEGWTGDRNQ